MTERSSAGLIGSAAGHGHASTGTHGGRRWLCDLGRCDLGCAGAEASTGRRAVVRTSKGEERIGDEPSGSKSERRRVSRVEWERRGRSGATGVGAGRARKRARRGPAGGAVRRPSRLGPEPGVGATALLGLERKQELARQCRSRTRRGARSEAELGEHASDVAGVGGDLDETHLAAALGADGNICRENAAQQPGPAMTSGARGHGLAVQERQLNGGRWCADVRRGRERRDDLRAPRCSSLRSCAPCSRSPRARHDNEACETAVKARACTNAR